MDGVMLLKMSAAALETVTTGLATVTVERMMMMMTSNVPKLMDSLLIPKIAFLTTNATMTSHNTKAVEN